MTTNQRYIYKVILLCLIVGWMLTINYYENKIFGYDLIINDGLDTAYVFTAQETIEMIKKLKEYQGDNLSFSRSGNLVSSNTQINGGINAIYSNTQQLTFYSNVAKKEMMPVAVVIYRTIATYYIEENKKK